MHLVYEIIIEYFWKISSFLYLAKLKQNDFVKRQCTTHWNIGLKIRFHPILRKWENAKWEPTTSAPQPLSGWEKGHPPVPTNRTGLSSQDDIFAKGTSWLNVGCNNIIVLKICKSLMKLNAQGLAEGGLTQTIWKQTPRKEKRTCYSVKA